MKLPNQIYKRLVDLHGTTNVAFKLKLGTSSVLRYSKPNGIVGVKGLTNLINSDMISQADKDSLKPFLTEARIKVLESIGKARRSGLECEKHYPNEVDTIISFSTDNHHRFKQQDIKEPTDFKVTQTDPSSISSYLIGSIAIIAFVLFVLYKMFG